MVTSIASLATALSQQQLAVEVAAKLMETAKDAVQDQGSAVLKLLESAQLTDVHPYLGSIIDLRA